MKVRFEIGFSTDDLLLNEKDFLAKIDESIKQAELGNTIKITQDQQKGFLGL